MPIAVTGSIATDQLMHFPGKFHDQLVADQLDRISLSFLVDDLVHPARRIGRATSRSAWACSGSAPLLVGAVGDDFAEYRELAGEPRRRLLAGSWSARTSTPRASSAPPTTTMRQIGSFYTGAMAAFRRDRPRPGGRPGRGADRSSVPATRSAMVQYTKQCRRPGHAVRRRRRPSRSRAWTAPTSARLVEGARYLMTNDYEWELLPAEDRLDRGPGRRARRHPHHHPRRERRPDLGPRGRRAQGRRRPRDRQGRPHRRRRRVPRGLPRRHRAGPVAGALRPAGLAHRGGGAGVPRWPGVDLGPRHRRRAPARRLRPGRGRRDRGHPPRLSRRRQGVHPARPRHEAGLTPCSRRKTRAK